MSVLLHTLIPSCIIVVEGAFSILLPFFSRFRVLFIGALLLKSVVGKKRYLILCMKLLLLCGEE